MQGRTYFEKKRESVRKNLLREKQKPAEARAGGGGGVTNERKEPRLKEHVDLSRDDQREARQQHLRELDVEHQVKRPHVVLAHEFVLVRPRAPVEAERHEQQR